MTGALEGADAWRVAIPAATGRARFFFRADDVGWDDAALWPMLNLFADREMPLDLAVIPGALHPDLIKKAASLCDQAGGRMRIHQHGWRHENHEPQGRKCEFGPARAADLQRRDLRQGREALEAAFDGPVDSIFTPPWNRCTWETADLCVQEGIRALSRDATASPIEGSGLAEIPISVDWNRAKLDVSKLGDGIETALSRGMPVGVMLHHALMTPEDRSGLGSFLDLLMAEDRIECVNMRDCLGLPEPIPV